MDLYGKTVLVCGMGRSGAGAAGLLRRNSAIVTLQDINESPNFGENFDPAGYNTYFGKNPDDILENFDMLVVSPGVPTGLPFFAKAQKLGIPLIGEMELAAAYCKAPILAITGTNGKTTTTSLLGAIIAAKNPQSPTVGNIGVAFSNLADSIPADALVAAEVSSFQLETIRDFRPLVSAVLNISRDHLDRHGTYENYIAMKERIFQNQQAGDFTVLNFDNPITRAMAAKTRTRVCRFSMQPLDEGVYLEDEFIAINWDGRREIIIKADELPIPGRHNIENAMAAAAMALCAGISTELIAAGLRDFGQVEHRIEFVREMGGVRFYNDSKATNVDSAIKGILAMDGQIILIAGGVGKDQDFADLAANMHGRVRHAILIGEAADEIAQVCATSGFADISFADNLPAAIADAAKMAKSGDCVLLSPACASFDMFDNFEQRGRAFKEIVMKL